MAESDEDFFENEDDELLLATVEESLTRPPNYEELDGFDEVAGERWIYPINYPLRSYQFNIVQKSLFWNTLVTLPTGLGKTFIAAVVIHNFYRWYPRGKILFMAPTKPLVAQQIRACHDIVGIPQKDLGELTGNLNPTRRDKIWSSKRVFFLTPQIVQNDLGRGSCPASEIVLVVIDEAHKATGNHAYCQVVRELQNYKQNFRVLALSATPGDNLNTVQSVLTNLCISHIEIRSDESIDIQPYTHKKNITKVILPLDTGLLMIKDILVKQVLEPYVTVLTTHRALYCSDVQNLSKYTLLQQRESWRGRSNLPGQVASMVEGVFFVLMNLYHAYELLLVHGAGTFLHYCIELLEGKKGNNSTKSKLLKDGAFLSLIDKVQRWRNSGKIHEANNAPFIDHPKLQKLEEVLLQHFENSDNATRAMVFSSFRDSVSDLVKYINKHSPKLRSSLFVGQSGEKGLKQKDQLATVQRFKKGEFNILVATCVGEEGLDIGMVDLIVCFDASASPTRLVQRMGRAARKREGSVVVLLTQGKEEQVFKKSMSSKQSVSKVVMTKLHKLVLYQDNPRMIPRHLNPLPDKQVLKPVEFVTPPPKTKSKTSLQKQKCPYLSSTQYNSYTDLSPFSHRKTNYSLSDCLSKWIHWQGTEHPTFRVDHSMSTLTFVHVMEVNDLFRSEPTAINKYEEEMLQYLNLDDVIIPTSTKRPDTKPTDLKQRKELEPKWKKNIVISDDDEEFDSNKNKLKQSKLNFDKAKPSQKSALFSCIPKTSTTITPDTKSTIKTDKLLLIDVDDETYKVDEDIRDKKNEDTVEDGLSEDTIFPENCSLEDLPEICDIQHNISLDVDIPFSVSPSTKHDITVSPRKEKDKIFASPEMDKSGHDITSKHNDVTENSKLAAELINMKEEDLSISLFEAINETWEFELSQKHPKSSTKSLLYKTPSRNLIPSSHIALDADVPSEIPDISDADLFFRNSQIPDNSKQNLSESLNIGDQTFKSDLNLKDKKTDTNLPTYLSNTGEIVPTNASNDGTFDTTCSGPRTVTSLSNKVPDDTFDILCSQSFSSTQSIDLFESLAKLEKESTKADKENDDDILDITMTDLDITELPQDTTESKFLPDSASTPAVHKQVLSKLSRKKETFVAPLAPTSLPSPKFVAPISPLCKQPNKAQSRDMPYPSLDNMSGEDSPLIVGKRKRRCNILSSQIPDITENKKSRYISPLKQRYPVKTSEHPKCLFVEDEADVSGDDEDEAEDEDILTSSLEDFLDCNSQVPDEGESEMYLKDIVNSRQKVRTVGKMFRGNVYSQDPGSEDSDDGEFDSFICDDEEHSLVDCLEETAIFTQHQAVNSPTLRRSPTATPSPLPDREKRRKKKRRVKQFGSLCETPHKANCPDTPKANKSSCVAPSTAEKSTFLLGLDDLLPDDQDNVISDEDFENPTNITAKTGNNKSITAAAAYRNSKTVPFLETAVQSNMAHNESVDLFGESLNDSMLDKVCGELESRDVTSSSHAIQTRGMPSRDKVHPAVKVQKSDQPITASQFQLGLDDLITTPPPLADRLASNVIRYDTKPGHKVSYDTTKTPNMTSLSHDIQSHDMSTSPNVDLKDCLILVRNKVVSNNQICSILRARFKCSVEIRSDLEGCDYVVNSKTAVLRISLTDVYKGLSDVLQRAKQLSNRYRQIVFITELPPSNIKKKVGQKQDVYDAVKCALAARQVSRAGASLNFSNSQEDTTELITKLVLTPGTMPIPTTTQTDKQKCMEKMLMSVPCINPGAARLLSLQFPSISTLLNSKPDAIIRASDLSSLNAALLLKYCKTNVANQLS